MTLESLIDQLAKAIALMEGFFVTPKQAKQRGIKYPTRAQRNANPGNIRRWRNSKYGEYPRDEEGYVNFNAWANENGLPESRALQEGWRVLRTVVKQYIDGVYHGGKSPTLYEFFERYAPSKDKNDPKAYAEKVASILKIPPDKPLKGVVES